MRRWHAIGAGCAALVVGATLSTAHAVDALDVAPPASAPAAPGGTEQAVVAQYWELGRVRWFGAMTLEAGYAYLKPRLYAGYGQPFWRWVGIEAYPIASAGGLGHYAGIGAAIPGISVNLGGRYYYPFERSYLPPQDRYTRQDLDLQAGPQAQYLALEAEMVATVPFFVGSLFGVLSGYRTELVPDGSYLFEESLRTVMKPPYIWRARLGYLLAFLRNGAIRVGPAAEVVGMPGRNERVVRGGLVASVLMSAHLEAQASLVPVWVSPDSLGIAGGDFGQLGIRLRLATDSTPDPDRVREAAGLPPRLEP